MIKALGDKSASFALIAFALVFAPGSGLAETDGFAISIDGEAYLGDPFPNATQTRADVLLAEAGFQVRYDGLDLQPTLQLQTQSETGYGPGSIVSFVSQMNYEAFVERGEVRVFDLASPSPNSMIARLPISANGRVNIRVPEGKDLVAVYRVYDSIGRFDETVPVTLMSEDDRGLSVDADVGSDAAAQRNIPLEGGMITVAGRGLTPGEVVSALGVTSYVDRSGNVVIRSILPVGTHNVEIVTNDVTETSNLIRNVTIPASESFRTGIIDVTASFEKWGDEPEYRGSIAFYSRTRTASGFTITTSADTGEDELQLLFSDLEKKDPHSVMSSIDSGDSYPVFGDDSSFVDNTPTSGKLYLSIEHGNRHLTWGDTQVQLNGSKFIRNDRTLYGLSTHFESSNSTSFGSPHFSLDAYGAMPDRVPRRDVFLGTGGTIYYLSKQSISYGSEDISIEIKDKKTGRIVDRKSLAAGSDYTINYTQGLVRLVSPLFSSVYDGSLISEGGAEYEANLVVQYEYSPPLTEVAGHSYGGRSEVWLGDHIRFAASGLRQVEGADEYTIYGSDLRLRFSEGSYVDLEIAKSEGIGSGHHYSVDGGQVFNEISPIGSSGEARRAEVNIDLEELGVAQDGYVKGYYEEKTNGFSTQDHQITEDEVSWGAAIGLVLSEYLELRAYQNDFQDAGGKIIRESGAELDVGLNENTTVTVAVEQTEKVTDSEVGDRLDVAAKLAFEAGDNSDLYLFGQRTLQADGLAENNRYGIGGRLAFSEELSLEGEISNGDLGLGYRSVLSFMRDQSSSAYFGYELNPDRQLPGVPLVGDDLGRWVAGGTTQLNDRLAIRGENSYDLFGQHRSLSNSYGIDYSPNSYLIFMIANENTQVDDGADSDFDRNSVSLGFNYSGESRASSGRVEYRRDSGDLEGAVADAETILVSLASRFDINDDSRFLLSLRAIRTETDESSVLDGEVYESTIGYALRPSQNDYLNLLFKYHFYYDMYGQIVEGENTPGPVQISHVLSLDAEQELGLRWTLGAKVGFRFSETAPTAGDPLMQNNAWLGVLNARYHLAKNWDFLTEARLLYFEESELADLGFVVAGYRNLGESFKLGVGYNFGAFSDDLTDLAFDDQGYFVNVVAAY